MRRTDPEPQDHSYEEVRAAVIDLLASRASSPYLALDETCSYDTLMRGAADLLEQRDGTVVEQRRRPSPYTTLFVTTRARPDS